MKIRSWFGPLALACLVTVCVAAPAFAVPPLPSSFYGTIKVSGANVADGTVVRALIDGKAIAQGRTKTYQGGSVYSVDVNGDDTDTAAVDGGHEGDTVQFEIGGLAAAQTGTWHGGTNVEVNLTASGQPAAASPTEPPAPTQTPIARPVTAATARSSAPFGWLVLAIGAVVVAAGGTTAIVRRKNKS